jgi:hypothetical protein
VSYTFRHIPLVWTGPTTPNPKPVLFKMDWRGVLKQLSYELERLGAHLDSVTLAVDVGPGYINRDGSLRARAVVNYRGVILSWIDDRGPISMPCDVYDQQWSRFGRLPSWQANTHSIGLALEALRAVDRYGVSSSGQQYQGFRELGSGIAMPASTPAMTRRQAAEFLVEQAKVTDDFFTGGLFAIEQVLAHSSVRRMAYRTAAKRLHPDYGGGDPAMFARLTEAMEVLDAVTKEAWRRVVEEAEEEKPGE